METNTLKSSSTFAADIKAGFSKIQKSIPFKYFYDERGSWLFQQIMQLPEYYLTSSEIEILKAYQNALLTKFKKGKKAFNLVDLGAGDATKTKILLEAYHQQNVNFKYSAVDLSDSILTALTESVHAVYPELNYDALNMDYWQAMEEVQSFDGRNVVLFLGANIGNFNFDESVDFLRRLKSYLKSDDYLLLGFDLKKRPEIIYKAYSDSKGITAAFNLNLLHRINNELGANFKTNYFRFYPYYNPSNGELVSHLVSLKEQQIYISELDMQVQFDQWDTIHTEVSKKYTINEIKVLLEHADLEIEELYYDHRSYFVDVLIRKK